MSRRIWILFAAPAFALLRPQALHRPLSPAFHLPGAGVAVPLALPRSGPCDGTLGKWGDANGDGTVNIIDAQQLARFSVGLSVANLVAVQTLGDVTDDGVVNIIDAQQVARFSVALSAAARVNTPASLPPVVANLNVTPPTLTLGVGGTALLTGNAFDAGGNNVSACVQVNFSSSDPTHATVQPSGVVTGVAAGGATITASSGTATGSAVVTVTGAAINGVLRVSTVNPRYFTDATGRAIYLAGANTWLDLMDAGPTDPPRLFDWAAYLDFTVQRGNNLLKFWRWEHAKWSADTSGDVWYAPNAFARPGPGAALDGKPKFDLTQFNQAYFDRLRQRVIDAGQRGIYVSLQLFSGWSLDDKGHGVGNPWHGHPMQRDNNINGIDGDPNQDDKGWESHTMAIPAIVAIHEAYARKVIDAVNDLDNVLYDISNEDQGGIGAEAWQYHMIQYIKSYEAGKPKQHPVGMSALYPNGADATLFASQADWISVAGNSGTSDTPPATGAKVMLNDTDHLCGLCGDQGWVWRSFTRGVNLVYMDWYDGYYPVIGSPDPNDPILEIVRKNLGYTINYAKRMNLIAMTPHGELCSTSYCIANPGGSAAEFLVWVPGGGSVSVDLSSASGTLNVEWFLPGTAQTIAAGTTTTGGSRTFTAPASADAVLYIRP